MEQTSVEDILIRSRGTILDLLHERGYNTRPYKKLIGPDLMKLMGNPGALRMEVVHSNDSTKLAIVEYHIKSEIKGNLTQGKFLKEIISSLETPEKTEVIIIYMPKNISEDTIQYDKTALEAWNTYKVRIQFFPMTRLVNNPLNHMLQPKFKIVPPENHEELLKSNYARSKTQFPLIRFHQDMVARCLGLVPGDIIEITRPSFSAGEYVSYRTCVP